MVELRRVELPTSCMLSRRSTDELQPQCWWRLKIGHLFYYSSNKI